MRKKPQKESKQRQCISRPIKNILQQIGQIPELYRGAQSIPEIVEKMRKLLEKKRDWAFTGTERSHETKAAGEKPNGDGENYEKKPYSSYGFAEKSNGKNQGIFFETISTN